MKTVMQIMLEHKDQLQAALDSANVPLFMRAGLVRQLMEDCMVRARTASELAGVAMQQGNQQAFQEEAVHFISNMLAVSSAALLTAENASPGIDLDQLDFDFHIREMEEPVAD